VAKMTKLVEEAPNNKSKTQRFIDKFCSILYCCGGENESKRSNYYNDDVMIIIILVIL